MDSEMPVFCRLGNLTTTCAVVHDVCHYRLRGVRQLSIRGTLEGQQQSPAAIDREGEATPRQSG